MQKIRLKGYVPFGLTISCVAWTSIIGSGAKIKVGDQVILRKTYGVLALIFLGACANSYEFDNFDVYEAGATRAQLDASQKKLLQRSPIGADYILDGTTLVAFMTAFQKVKEISGIEDGVLDLNTRLVSLKRDGDIEYVRFSPKIYPFKDIDPERYDATGCNKKESIPCYVSALGSRYMIVVDRRSMEILDVIPIDP